VNPGGGAAGFLGEITLTDGGYFEETGSSLAYTMSSLFKVSTNAGAGWNTNLNYNDSSWPNATEIGKNGIIPWSSYGSFPEISNDAYWIWSNNYQEYTPTPIDSPVYFRCELTPVSPIPEPATLSLFGLGLFGLAGLRKKKK
jgi:hypothetical protein